MRLPLDWRLWFVTVAIVFAIGSLVAWNVIARDDPSCFPAQNCRDIPTDDLR